MQSARAAPSGATITKKLAEPIRTANASFVWTFDIRISGTQQITTQSLEKDLGRNRPQIRRGLGLIRARVSPSKCRSFNTQQGAEKPRPSIERRQPSRWRARR